MPRQGWIYCVRVDESHGVAHWVQGPVLICFGFQNSMVHLIFQTQNTYTIMRSILWLLV